MASRISNRRACDRTIVGLITTGLAAGVRTGRAPVAGFTAGEWVAEAATDGLPGDVTADGDWLAGGGTVTGFTGVEGIIQRAAATALTAAEAGMMRG